MTGELDLATAPRLAATLEEAADGARLVLLDLGDVTFVDCAGLRVVLEATRAAVRDGRRLVVARPSRPVTALLELTGRVGAFDVLAIGDAQASMAGRPHEFAIANPVNARIQATRVMAVVDRRLWLHTDDGRVERAWVPEPRGEVTTPGRPIKLYLDEHGVINGWLDPISHLAVNQRHLDADRPPADAVPMVCQGRCGVTWQAPAAAQLIEHDERCLTCAGPLAPG